MSLTTPLIFQVHAVPESRALCWSASIEGQVLRAILSPKAFANVDKRKIESLFNEKDPLATQHVCYSPP